jgi:hypothetical protein
MLTQVARELEAAKSIYCASGKIKITKNGYILVWSL